MKSRAILMTSVLVAGSCVALRGAQAQMQPPAGQMQQGQAQQSEDGSPQAEILDEINKIQQQAGEVQDQLDAVARKAQEENPQLQKMQTGLIELYREKLTEYGYPSDDELQQLQAMQQRLQSQGNGSMDEAERQQLTQTFNERVSELQQAQEKAQRDEDFIQAQQAFEQARAQAMLDVNPQVEAMENELQGLQTKLAQLRRQLQQHLQGSGMQ